MSRFSKGTAAMEAADEARNRSGGGFTPYIRIAADDKKYLQFITPLDEIPGALLHQFVTTGFNSNSGKPIYNNFISARDKSLDGPSGEDELQDRFGLNPTYRLFAVAVEMDPIVKTVSGKKKITGFEPKMRTWTDKEGEEHESVVSGVVIQAKANFFGQLQTWEQETGDDMTDKVWSVSRDDNVKSPTYTFVATAQPALDLADFAEDFPNLDEWMDSIADPEHWSMISDLPDDFQVSKYAGKGKGKDAKESKTTTRKPSKTAVVDDADEDEDEPVKAEFETTEEKKETKAERWKRLRAETKAADNDAAEEDDE